VGQEIALMPGMSVIDTIGERHTALHNMYFKIFQIYFGNSTMSFFSKLLKMKKKISPAEEEMALQYYNDLEGISKELLEMIGRLERRINALSEEFFTAK